MVFTSMTFSLLIAALIYILMAVAIISILYNVIGAATRSKERFKYEVLRTRLLMKIALKNGVPMSEMEQLINQELGNSEPQQKK